MTLVLFLLGLILLIAGAELLVRGASALAAAVGISPLVIGLTVVAFGTSAPELAVTVRSSISGHSDLALGNVVGSNIVNILLILGVSAAIVPLVVASQVIRREVPLMVAASAAVLVMALDGVIGRTDGALLFGGLILYIVMSVRLGRRACRDAPAAETRPCFSRGQLAVRAAMILAGLAALIAGTDLLVNAAVAVAQALGASELVIGLTIVATGTSLPEAATSVVAAIKGERDIAVGNAVGSNLFNILGILGLAGLIAPVSVSPAALHFDIPVMLAVAVACLPIFWTGNQIARWEGGLFIIYYAAYLAWVILSAAARDTLPAFAFAMKLFVLPMTLVTILIMTVRSMRQARARRLVVNPLAGEG